MWRILSRLEEADGWWESEFTKHHIVAITKNTAESWKHFFNVEQSEKFQMCQAEDNGKWTEGDVR